MTNKEELVKKMVDRFLGWKLPEDFAPDCHIHFDRDATHQWGGYPNGWPIGTNLLNADQAKAMILHMLGDDA